MPLTASARAQGPVPSAGRSLQVPVFRAGSEFRQLNFELTFRAVSNIFTMFYQTDKTLPAGFGRTAIRNLKI